MTSFDPIVICSYARTPIGGFQGALSSVKATELDDHPVKGGRDDDEIVQVSGPKPGIVGDEDVAAFSRHQRKPIYEVEHRCGHRIDVPRRARDRLSDHAALRIEETR